MRSLCSCRPIALLLSSFCTYGTFILFLYVRLRHVPFYCACTYPSHCFLFLPDLESNAGADSETQCADNWVRIRSFSDCPAFAFPVLLLLLHSPYSEQNNSLAQAALGKTQWSMINAKSFPYSGQYQRSVLCKPRSENASDCSLMILIEKKRTLSTTQIISSTTKVNKRRNGLYYLMKNIFLRV